MCPPNSKSSFAASAECPCLSGYFRTPTEGAGTGCTGGLILLLLYVVLKMAMI